MFRERGVLPLSTRKPCRRSGASFLEVMGCFCALTGGMVFGSMYLGVDVKGVLHGFMQPASTATASVAASPASAAHEASQAAHQPPATVTQATETPGLTRVAPSATHPSASEMDDADSAELEPTPSMPAAIPAAAPALTDVISLTDDQRHALTIAYWRALDDCMKAEVANRVASMQVSGNWELYAYLSCRSEGHATAAAAIAHLNQRGVDGHVTSYAEKAQAWHTAGADLYARARDLLTDAPTAQFTGPFAQSWQSAATQHQMEERLLAEKHQSVQAYLGHTERVSQDAATPLVAPGISSP